LAAAVTVTASRPWIARPKLLVTWHFGRRSQQHTEQFIARLDAATFGHFHISSDGWRSYLTEIKNQLGYRVDHGVVHKIFGLATRQHQLAL